MYTNLNNNKYLIELNHIKLTIQIKMKSKFTFFLFMIASVTQAQIEYACIKNHQLYIYEYSTDSLHKTQSNYILRSQKGSPIVTKTEIPTFRGNKLKIIWDILNDQLVSGTAISFTPSNSLALIRLSPIEVEDTLTVSIKYSRIIDSLSKLNNGNRKLAIANYKLNTTIEVQSSQFYPLYKWLTCSSIQNFTKSQWINQIIKKHSFDITVYNSSIFILHRKGSIIEVWKWNYSQHASSNIQNKWERIKSFETGDSSKSLICDSTTHLDTLGKKNNPIPTIVDRNMIEGKLKLIIQGSNMFVFNLNSGKIYHLGKQINIVGEILGLKEPTLNFFEKALLVEDKDKSTILSIQQVKRYQNTDVFPIIEYLTKQELEGYFK